jgi:hypothetical protein
VSFTLALTVSGLVALVASKVIPARTA